MGVGRELCLLAALALAAPAAAHGRYPHDCCSDQDCRPALVGEIEAMPDGRFLIVPTGEIFARWQVRPSFDHNFHRCVYDPSAPVSRTFCLLVPGAS
jgi:hypothetical protein